MDLFSHLKALQDRQLIDEEIIQIVLKAQGYLIEQWEVDCEKPQVVSLLIHLANSIGRVKRQGCVSALHQDFLLKIKSADCYSVILTIHQDILSFIPFHMPENEKSYFLANYYALLLDQPQIVNRDKIL